MAHEHNRPDRDTYIRVDYHCLADWPDCWNRARSAEGGRITEDGLCLDMYAIKYGCSCSAYIINLVEPGWPITSMIGYDLSSIMHYPSVNGDATEECRMNGDGCALEEWVHWNDHDQGTQLLYQMRKPSEMDLLWVKITYPWHVET
ncbi:hypothetical protein Ptr902_12299 [Pyrenophora tritici-repentis]|nr:hypothetical protein Ptr902_12299 [Pyrenophora tritici-repentis]